MIYLLTVGDNIHMTFNQTIGIHDLYILLEGFISINGLVLG